MTVEELAEIVGKMTPGPWEADSGSWGIFADDSEGDPWCVAEVSGEHDTYPKDHVGIVALRNHFPEMTRRYRLMQEALRVAAKSINDGFGGLTVFTALSESGKPLEDKP